MECLFCKGTMVKATAPFSVDRQGYHVHWDALPAWVCRQCGEPYFEGSDVDRIQRLLAGLDHESAGPRSVPPNEVHSV